MRGDLQHATHDLDAVLLLLQISCFSPACVAQGVMHETGVVQFKVRPAWIENVAAKAGSQLAVEFLGER